MRITVTIVILCLCFIGCSRPDGRAFDGLMSSNRIDRIEIVDDDQGRTNVLTGERVAHLLARLSASNRVADPVRGRSEVTGRVMLYAQGQYLGGLAYFPREQVLSYHKYEFSLRDTNDLSTLFR